MALKIGTDMVYIPRITALLSNDSAIARTFKQSELNDRDPSHLAGIFAAKESIFKALGVPPSWLDVEISRSPDGKPSASISKSLGRAEVIDISISHDGDYAIAFAVIELDD